MSKCIECNSRLDYTTYIRAVQRNEDTHRSKQQFLPVGIICLDCHNIQWTLGEGSLKAIRARRSKQHLPDTAE